MLVVLGSLIVACGCAYQAIFTLRTGQLVWFFGTPARSSPVRGVLQRLAYALIYLIPSVGILAILATALARAGLARILGMIPMNTDVLLSSFLFIVPGLLIVWRPAMTLRFLIRTHPELAEMDSMLVVTRVVGVVFIAMGVRILADV